MILLFLVISVINKEHVLDTKCFQYFQFILQLFVRIGDHSYKCTCLKFDILTFNIIDQRDLIDAANSVY